MKKLEKLKLNQLEKSSFSEKEMHTLKGGSGAPCYCSCIRSSTDADNDGTNKAYRGY